MYSDELIQKVFTIFAIISSVKAFLHSSADRNISNCSTIKLTEPDQTFERMYQLRELWVWNHRVERIQLPRLNLIGASTVQHF